MKAVGTDAVVPLFSNEQHTTLQYRFSDGLIRTKGGVEETDKHDWFSKNGRGGNVGFGRASYFMWFMSRKMFT